MTVGATDKTISASDGAVASSEEDLPAGTTVGEYVLEAKLGEGGFGAVYKAMHPVIGKAAAVKVLHRSFSSNAEIVTRFIAEARAVNQIRHRNIVDIFAFGRLPDGRQYYVMELLEGVPLDKHLERAGRLTLREAIPILRSIGKALDAAHAQGIVHRDLKPENVFLVTQDDGTFFPKLVDFGIAKLMGNESPNSGPQHKTRTGTLIGTPYYMSPEQCRGVGVDHRTDIYAFGVMTHRMLSGQLPFDGTSAMDIMMGHVSKPPPQLSSLLAELPFAVDAPIQKMLAKDPNDRPQNVSTAVDELEAAAALGATEPKRPPMTTPQVSSSASTLNVPAAAVTDMGMVESAARKGGRSWMLIAGALIGVGAIVAGVWMLKKPPSEASPAPTTTKPVAAASTSAQPTATVTQTATATTSAAPAIAASVFVRVEANPKNAEVSLGEQKLGQAPGPFAIARGDQAVTLKVTAPGFAAKTVSASAATDSTVNVTLTPSGPAKKTISGDLENPF